MKKKWDKETYANGGRGEDRRRKMKNKSTKERQERRRENKEKKKRRDGFMAPSSLSCHIWFDLKLYIVNGKLRIKERF